MELNFAEKKVIKAVVEDLKNNPTLVGLIEETALTQNNPLDFQEALRTVIRVRGIGLFPRFKAVLEEVPENSGMSAADFSFGEAMFSLLEVGVTAGAGYMGAKLMADTQEDMLRDKIGFEERMANREFEVAEKQAAAMEEYNRLISQANSDPKNQPPRTSSGSSRSSSGSGTTQEEGLPKWVMPVAIGAGALAVGYVALK